METITIFNNIFEPSNTVVPDPRAAEKKYIWSYRKFYFGILDSLHLSRPWCCWITRPKSIRHFFKAATLADAKLKPSS